MASTGFSYAQAAKGKTVPKAEPLKDSTNTENAQIDNNTNPTADIKNINNSSEISKPDTQDAAPIPTQAVTNGVTTPHIHNDVKSHTKVEGSREVSPNSSHAATKSSKGEDNNGTTGESETTWEKLSQESRKGSNVSRAEVEETTTRLSTIEHSRPQFKEASVPVVNIWQKRMQDALSSKNTDKTPIPAMSNTTARVNVEGGQKRPANKPITSTSASAVEATTQTKASKAGQAATPAFSADTTAWPTPNVVKTEEKKKEVESQDGEKPPSKPHAKEKWNKMDFVPTAVFNTPLPNRGGARGGRLGGRGGHGGHHGGRGGSFSAANGIHGTNGDRPATNSTTDASAQTSQNVNKSRDNSATRGNQATKGPRNSSTGPSTKPQSDDARVKRDTFAPRNHSNERPTESRRTSGLNQDEGIPNSGAAESHSREMNGEHKFARPERPYQQRSRESGAEQAGYIPTNWSTRERGEGPIVRGGRGGGNWRGKSGAPVSSSNSHYQPHGLTNGKPYSEQRHGSHPTSFVNTRESRHSRGNSRSQSIPNGQPTGGRYGVQSGMTPNGLPGLQTDMVNNFPYAQPPSAVMSAIPYQPHMEPVDLPRVIGMQLDYYFSVDNLLKDVHFRKHMDGQGFINLQVIANFRRIQALTQDINLLRYVCGRHSVIELRTDVDGTDRVRKSEGWEQWVLPIEDRDPSAQNDGSTQLMSPRFEGFQSMFGGFEMPPPMVAHSNPMSPVGGFMMNGFRPDPFQIDTSGPRGHFVPHSASQTPLSADVPDFKPAQAPVPHPPIFQGPPEIPHYIDADLAAVRVTVHYASTDDPSKLSPVLGPLSNGHVKEGIENGHSPNGVANGSNAKGLAIVPNGYPSFKKPTVAKSVRPRITWTTSDSSSAETYELFHSRAIMVGKNAPMGQTHEEMVNLYEFWSLFLASSFKTKLYEEFHNNALQDANIKQNLTGVHYLTQFFAQSVYRPEPLPERIISDFVALATVEFGTQHLPDRPAFRQLRRVWRDGAMNFDHRAKLHSKMSDGLRNALDTNPYAQTP